MNHAIRFVFLSKTNTTDRTDGEASDGGLKADGYYSYSTLQAEF